MNNRLITAIVAVVILVVGLQVIGTIDDGDSSSRPEWQYDDYKIIPEATAATGSVEITTVGSTQYVHAKSTGPGEITMSNGSKTAVDVKKAYLDVFLMTGQSNAAYYSADPATASPVPLPGTAYYYGTSSTFRPSSPDGGEFLSMIAADGSAAIGDKAPSFAAKYYDLTGHKVYWMCGATGGRMISTFQPTNGTSWLYMQSIVYYAMNSIDRDLFIPVIKSYMWIQGESDRNNDIDYYEENFLNMNNSILKGALGYSFDHCFISKIAAKDGGNAALAQIALAESHPGIITLSSTTADTFTVENGLMASDNIHYTQAGDNIIGVELAESVAEWYEDNDKRTFAEDLVFGIVPILLIVGVIIGIVSYAIMRRD